MWIIAAAVGGYYASLTSIYLLAWGVVVAFMVQWLILLPTSLKILPVKISWEFLKKTQLFSPSVRLMSGPFMLGALGMGATQINMALDSLFATAADLQGPAFLWYAIRIEQVPMALFGVAISAALLPALVRVVKAGNFGGGDNLLQQGLKRSFALMTFSTFGLLALGRLVVMMLFARGAFDCVAVEETTKCLWCYSLGLIPHAAVLLLAAHFYAYEDFKTPMRGSVYAVILNILMNAFMVFILHLGASSIALATSVTSLLNCLYLNRQLKKRRSHKIVPGVFYVKTLTAGAVTWAMTCGLQSFAFKTVLLEASSLIMLGALTFLGGFYVAAYFFLEGRFKCGEVFSLVKEIGRIKES
jgi:putative peptidoglycan lipid II flippase